MISPYDPNAGFDKEMKPPKVEPMQKQIYRLEFEAIQDKAIIHSQREELATKSLTIQVLTKALNKGKS